MFCPNCGSQLPDGSVFCSNCGKSLSNAAQNANNQQANGAPVYYAPKQPNQIVLLLKECLEKAKRFLSSPKTFIESFMQGEQYSKNMPIAFIGIEVVAGILFALSIRFAISSIAKHYVNYAMGSYSSYGSELFKVNEIIKSFSGTVFSTIAVWVIILIAIMWIVRFLFVKFLVQDIQKGTTAFACISVISVVEIVAYIISIFFVLLLSTSLKFDIKAIQAAMSSNDYYSGNQFTQIMSMVSSFISQFKFLLFVLVVFMIVMSLVLILHVLCISRFVDAIEKTDNTISKKGKLFVAVFALALVLFDKFYLGFVIVKVAMALVPQAALLGSLGF